MGRLLTLRGTIEDGDLSLLLDYEGVDLTKGWKVISGSTLTGNAPNISNAGIILHTDDQLKTVVNFDDNQIIGWAGGPPYSSTYDVIDPNHVIVNTLWASGLARVTYLIVLEEVTIDATQNVIYQLKERAQSALEPWTPPV